MSSADPAPRVMSAITDLDVLLGDLERTCKGPIAVHDDEVANMGESNELDAMLSELAEER